MSIAVIGEAILVILQSWKSGESVLNNIVNVIVAFAGVTGLSGSPIVNAFFRLATAVEAGLANLNSEGWTDAGSDTIDGTDYTVLIVKNNSTLGAQLGLGTAPTA